MKRAGLVTAIAIVVAALSLFVAGAASAGGTGTISGVVTDGSSNALVGVCVQATPTGSGTGGNTDTGAGGAYSISGLAAGAYTVSFTACTAGNYAPDTITGVQVTAGNTTTQNAALAAGATISGNVTDSANTPLNGACVEAEAVIEGDPGGDATTDSSGNYTITQLAAGTYDVVFSGCTAGDYQSSTTAGVQVAAGQTVTENAALQPGGTIAGVVSDSSNHPIANACVEADPSGGSGPGGGARTDASGAYSIVGLAPGTYSVAFTSCGAGNYAPDTITGVQVTVNATTTENATLQAGGIITGKVTNGSGTALAGACVSASGTAGGGNATTDSGGDYTINSLPSGTYSVSITACSAGDYQSKTISGVQVTAGQTVTENAVLQAGGTIAGAVTDSSNHPIPGACVDAEPAESGGQGGTAKTDASGSYSIAGLAPGTYALTFTPCGAGNYAPDTITGVQVQASATTTANATLQPGGTITGKVTNGSGTALVGACVSASSTTPGVGAGDATTDSNGDYTINGLGSGTYIVTFNPCAAGNYVPQTVSGVQVSTGQTVTENAALQAAGAIAGKVTDSSSNALAGVCVAATPSGGGTESDATTGAGGTYSFSELAPGTYTLKFTACSAGNYVPKTITGVQVTAGQTTTENVALATGGTISGKVTDSSGNPLLGACVTAASTASGGQSGGATTGSGGLYTISDLAPGAYSVSFDGCKAGNYVSQELPAVQVSAAQITTENTSLAPAGTISGKVINSAGKPVANICADATGSGPNGQSSGAATDANGLYSIAGLPPGTYSLTFTACQGGNYISKTVTGVTVTAHHATTENASLATGGTISGKVTDSSGKALAGACAGAILSGTDQGPGASTNASGVYTITGLAPGTYRVQFDGCSAGNYVEKTVNGVSVTVGKTATVNASLALGGTISGKVTNSLGKPVAGACVSAFVTGSEAGAGVNTDAAGRYTFSGQAPGTYTLTFDGCTAGNYAHKTVTGVNVTAGKTTTVNVSLVSGGTISGTVTDSSSKPLAGICVSAFPAGTTGGPGTTTDANGAYSISGLATGAYTLFLSDCTSGKYAVAAITGVKVTAGKTTTENATLVPGGTLTGKVTNGSGTALAGACVTIGPLPGGQTGTIKTDSGGAYNVSQVPPGTYTLGFSGCSAGNYVTKTVTGVTVTGGATTTVNAALVTAGKISGKVTNSSTTALSGACVSISGPTSASTTTNSSGVYTIGSLPAGSYTVTFKGCSAGNYLTKTITGVAVTAGKTTTENAALAAAGTVSGKVTNGSGTALVGVCVSFSGPQAASTTTVSGGTYTKAGLIPGTYAITFKGCTAGAYATKTIAGVAVTGGKTTTENATLTTAGTITGKVTNGSGTALSGACVSVPGFATTTNSGGTYTIAGLPAGSYALTFNGCSAGSYVTNTITGVAVVAGQATTENATLTLGGTIAGKITNSSGTPVVGACVSVSGPQRATTTSNSGGAYTFAGLPAGTYTLTFQGCTAGSYLTKTIPGVAVTAGKTTTENAALTTAGTLSGKVTNTSAAALAGVCVSASGPQTASTTTIAGGAYTKTGLAAGTYTLTFKGCSAGNYVTKTITGVVITAGKTTTENATLTPA